MKRLLTFGLIVCLAIGSVFASGKSETEKKTVLNFYIWDDAQKGSSDAIATTFEKQNPDIDINPVVVPWGQFWTKLQTSLPTEAGPDVFWMNDRALEYINAGLIMNLQDLVDEGKVDLADFPEALVKIYSAGDNLYGIPKDYNTIGVYYNKKIFDEMGVEYPSADWDWEDFRETAIKLNSADHYGYASSTSGQNCLNNFIMQNNGSIADLEGNVTVNTPEVYEAMKFLSDLVLVDKISPTYKELIDNSFDTLFLAGQIGMISYGSWGVKDLYEVYGDNLGIAPLPRGKRNADVIAGLAFCGSANTAHPEEVKRFLTFCASKEAQELMVTDVIPAFNGADKLWVKNFPDTIDTQVFVDAATYGDVVPPFKGNNNSVKKIFFEEMNKVWASEKDLATALSDAEVAMNKEIAATVK